MTIEQITDHQQKSKDRAPGFMQGATNMELFFDAIVAETQNLETVLFQLLDERHLSVAVGVQLDGIGQIVDLERIVGETDSEYRTRLISRTGEIQNGGEIEALIAAFIFVTELTAPDELIFNEVFPASVLMAWLTDSIDPEDPIVDASLVSAMNAIRAGGVRLGLTRNGLTNNFQFSDESEVVGGDGPIDADHGFGDEALSDGGQLGRVIAPIFLIYGYTSGGLAAAYTNVVEKFPFATDSNSADVGNLTVARYGPAGQSSSLYGYSTGGYTGSYRNEIDKFPFTLDINAVNVGDLTETKSGVAGQSSNTYGYTSGGSTGANSDVIDRFSFTTDGNAVDVGDLTLDRVSPAGQQSASYGYTSGGRVASVDTIDKFSFATGTENASDVGDLTVARRWVAGQSSTDYGYSSGGDSGSDTDVIDKFPFASDTDATDVGDLTVIRDGPAGQSSTTHGYTSGGGAPSNIIDKFSFSSDGNATDVGDLTESKQYTVGQQF